MKKYVTTFVSLNIVFIILFCISLKGVSQNENYKNRNKGGFVNQNHLKLLKKNDWVLNRCIVKAQNQENNYEPIRCEDSTLSSTLLVFKDSIITLNDETVGFLNIKFINHIDTLKGYGTVQYDVDRYLLSLDFSNKECLLSGSFRIVSISELILNIEQQTNKDEMLNVIFYAKGKDQDIKYLQENNPMDDFFD